MQELWMGEYAELYLMRKCGHFMSEHTRENSVTIIPGLEPVLEPRKTKVKCPNGRIFDSSIYGACPLCPDPATSPIKFEESVTRKFQEKLIFTNKPVVGFLYSISRGGITEFWPLHLGVNTIGCSYENDVVLSEASISSFANSTNKCNRFVGLR